ncbi:MAG TPA: hypothetical protein VEP49_14400 [Acidimicrobiia bacterium]|nr:hypothetical protein [Acidimicrobiia bacterium]
MNELGDFAVPGREFPVARVVRVTFAAPVLPLTASRRAVAVS